MTATQSVTRRNLLRQTEQCGKIVDTCSEIGGTDYTLHTILCTVSGTVHSSAERFQHPEYTVYCSGSVHTVKGLVVYRLRDSVSWQWQAVRRP